MQRMPDVPSVRRVNCIVRVTFILNIALGEGGGVLTNHSNTANKC